jgi:hypothetical protein
MAPLARLCGDVPVGQSDRRRKRKCANELASPDILTEKIAAIRAVAKNEGTYTAMTTDRLSLREANSLFSQT